MPKAPQVLAERGVHEQLQGRYARLQRGRHVLIRLQLDTVVRRALYELRRLVVLERQRVQHVRVARLQVGEDGPAAVQARLPEGEVLADGRVGKRRRGRRALVRLASRQRG